MPVTTVHVDAIVQAYLLQRPDQREHLAPLLEMLAAGSDLTGRQLLGHVTVSGIAIRSDGRIAQIHHKLLGLPLQPGGHLEDGDQTLLGGALREFCEETGIDSVDVAVVSDIPLHIAVMQVPGSVVRGEIEHWHFDVRFHLATEAAFGHLPEDEIGGAFWAVTDDLIDPSLRQAVAMLPAVRR